MRSYGKYKRPGLDGLFATLWALCPTAAFVVILGCSSVVSRRPLDDTFSGLDTSYLAKHSQGLAYFLPLGKVHIVATRNDNLVTNYGFMPEQVPGGPLLTNFITKVVITTNTFATNYTPTNYILQQFPATLTYSNSTSSSTNHDSGSQISSNATSSTNFTATTNFLLTNSTPAKNSDGKPVVNNPPPFSTNDIKDLSSLVNKLTNQSDQVSKYLWEELTNSDQKILMNYRASEPSAKHAQDIVLDCLNRLIGGPCIDDPKNPERFKDVNLRRQTTDLLKQSPTGTALALLNCWLLEDAYPLELLGNQKSDNSTNTVVSSTISSNVLASTTVSNVVAPTTLVTSITSSNAPATFYPLTSIYSNNTVTTITTEQPLVSTNYTYSVTISVDYVADRSNLFLLHPKMDWFHDDNVNLTVDSNGLLSTLVTSNTDQTGNVAVALAQAAGEAFELAAGGGVAPAPVVDPQEFSKFVEHKSEYALILTEDVYSPQAVASSIISRSRDLSLPLYDSDLAVLARRLGHYGDAERLESLSARFADQLDLTEMGSAYDNARIASADFVRSITNDLNKFINGTTRLDLNQFRKAGVVLRPETVWLSESLGQYKGDAREMMEKVLRRMLVDDTFSGRIRPFQTLFIIPPPVQPSPPPQLIDISFDPFNADEMDTAKAALKAGDLTIQNAEKLSKIPELYFALNNKLSNVKTGGVFYRPAFPYEVRIADNKANVISRSVLLPNKSPILHVDFDKGTLVTQVTQITMTNGFITSYGVDKPSQALAIAGLPVELMNAFTSGITNFVQMKFNIASGQSSLANLNQSNQMLAQTAQLQYLSNQMAILSLQQQLKTNMTPPVRVAPLRPDR